MFGYSSCFNISTHHESSYVLQENEWNLSLAAQFNEMGTLHGGLGEQNAVVGNNTYWLTIDLRETCNKGIAISLLKFVEARSIHYTGYYFSHFKAFLEIRSNDTK